MLEFLGRGSAFAPSHNNAFFTDGDDLVLIDCSMLSLQGVMQLCAQHDFRHIYIIVTHTHSDHVSGIGMLIHYAYYALNTPVTVAVPSDELAGDIRFLCERLDGCDSAAYSIVSAASLPWVKHVIPTVHSAPLDGRCFGYHLDVCGEDTVYTGDTNTLAPFEPYIGPKTVLYTEIAAIKSPVHLYICDALPRLEQLAESGTRVYLMHIDDEEKIRSMITGTALRLAPVTSAAG